MAISFTRSWLFTLFGLWTFCPSNLVAQLPDSVFQQYGSAFMEVLTPASPFAQATHSQYPFLAGVIRNNFFKYEPSGHSQELSPECQFRTHRDVYLEKNQDPLTAIADHLKRCQGEMETAWGDALSGAYLTTFIKLDPLHHPYAHHVVFHLPNGIQLKGLLALKGDKVKRPLVILRLGIFSNSQEFFPERSLFLQLFEQSPFNMLILESLSGTDFLHNNLQYSLGGFDEGLQNLQVAQALTKASEPLSQIIQSLHFFAVSMGGHGLFYAALLNEINDKPIAGFAALCPLLNFKETFDYHRSHALNLGLMNYWARNRMAELGKIFPDLNSDDFVTDVLQKINTNYRGPLSLDAGHPVTLPASAQSGDFFTRNNYWKDFKNIRTPILVIATEKDPIVPYDLNSQRLGSGQLATENVNLRMIPLRQGYHCSLPAAYNWKEVTSILQSYVWKNAGLQPVLRRLSLGAFLKPQEKYSFKATEEGLFVVADERSHFWSEAQFPIPLETLYWAQLQRPLSAGLLPLLQRWMEQNLEVVWQEGQASLQWDEVP